MVLENEGFLSTKNKRIFEAISLWSTTKVVGLIAQKQLEAGLFLVQNRGMMHFEWNKLLNIVSKNEEILLTQSEQAF